MYISRSITLHLGIIHVAATLHTHNNEWTHTHSHANGIFVGLATLLVHIVVNSQAYIYIIMCSFIHFLLHEAWQHWEMTVERFSPTLYGYIARAAVVQLGGLTPIRPIILHFLQYSCVAMNNFP